MKCVKCGKLNEAGAAFCNQCGSQAPLNLSDENFEIVDGVLVEYEGSGGDVVIPQGVIKIGWCAFSDCTSIKATYKGKIYTYDNIDDLYKAING